MHARVPTRRTIGRRVECTRWHAAATETELDRSARPLEFLSLSFHVRTFLRSTGGREEVFQGFRPLWYKPFPFVTNGNKRVSSPRFLVGGPYTVGGWWKRRLGFNLIERLRRLRGSFFFFHERLRGKNCLGTESRLSRNRL